MPFLGSSPARGLVGTTDIDDDAVTLAKMAHGTANQNISYDGSGVPVDVALSAGKVLQVVTSTKTDTASTTSTSFADTGLSAAITCAATSSKVLVIAHGTFGVNGTSAYAHCRLIRDSTAIHVGDSDSSNRIEGGAQFASTSNSIQESVSLMVLDSPSSTSELTYKLQYMTQSGSHAVFINRSFADGDDAGQGRGASSLTVLEIGA